MCGIVGYVGKKTSIKQAVTILKKLEYRGYDSSGVAYISNNKINYIKQVGQIDNLLSSINKESSKVCICHTRWATHGKVNQTNAHPQISFNGNFAVVHNGIIENYQELKQQIGQDKFVSQTDTEVIANLLEICTGTTLKRVQECTTKLIGSYALAITDKQDKYLYAAKNKSPLYVAQTDSGYMVASDISCFNSKSYYSLPDGIVAKISKNNIEFYLNGQVTQLEPTINNFNFDQVNLGDYKHYMAKEIDETSRVIDNICTRYSTIYDDLFYKDMFKNINTIYLVGCGTAYHACQMGASWLQTNII